MTTPAPEPAVTTIPTPAETVVQTPAKKTSLPVMPGIIAVSASVIILVYFRQKNEDP
jgi:hypothetical protein